MESLRQWTMAVCMACIVAGILQQLSGGKSQFSVIKLVLTLYILITAFAPIQAIKYPETRMTTPVLADAAPIDTEALILESTQKNLAETVAAACMAGGCPVEDVTVGLTQENGMVQVTGVTLILSDNADAQKAKQLAQTALGTQAPVTIVGKG